MKETLVYVDASIFGKGPHRVRVWQRSNYKLFPLRSIDTTDTLAGLIVLVVQLCIQYNAVPIVMNAAGAGDSLADGISEALVVQRAKVAA